MIKQKTFADNSENIEEKTLLSKAFKQGKQRSKFIITGGSITLENRKSSSVATAEIFNPLTHHTCPVGNLNNKRTLHTLCNNMVCGGSDSRALMRSCEMFDGITHFKRLPVRLVKSRNRHICWGLKSGDVLLLGGKYSRKTTERVSADGSSSSLDFRIPYDGIMWAIYQLPVEMKVAMIKMSFVDNE